MKLNYKEFDNRELPTDTTFIIQHGLFGSSKNWISNAKELSKLGKVYTLDLRNHGDSPHSKDHSLESMSSDLLEFIQTHEINKPVVIGHSMGGLVGMHFAFANPTLLKGLVVVDIAPRPYTYDYKNELDALRIDVSHKNSRQEIDREMSKILADPFIRQFLQMNLEKLEQGYKWKVNVDALVNSSLRFSHEDVQYENQYLGKTLFIIGEKSEYVKQKDLELIKEKFPHSIVEIIKNANHYLHYFHSKEFIEIVSDFERTLI